jgi:hypothetical protein
MGSPIKAFTAGQQKVTPKTENALEYYFCITSLFDKALSRDPFANNRQKREPNSMNGTTKSKAVMSYPW